MFTCGIAGRSTICRLYARVGPGSPFTMRRSASYLGLSTCAMMTPPTSWPSVCGRCTTTSRWSHHCCPSLVKRSAAAPPTHNQMLVQTSVCEASGLIAETHFLTRGCFIPTRRAISPEAYHLSFALSRMRRSVSTGNGSPRWSMAASHRWCFLPVEEWVRRPLWSLRSWRAP